MNWEAISAVAEVIGAVAIVITLIYLAVQLRQNTTSVRASAYQTWLAANVDLAAVTTNSDFADSLRKGLGNSADLTPGSEIAFGMWNHSAYQMWQALDTMYRMNAIDRSLWHSEMSRAAGHLGNPGVRQWWDAGGKTQLTPEFVKLLESTRSDITVWAWNPEKGYVSGIRGE